MNDHESRLRALEEARKELEDASIVMTHLETTQSNTIKFQAQATEETRRQMDEQRALNRETDMRIADLVSAVGRMISAIPAETRNA